MSMPSRSLSSSLRWVWLAPWYLVLAKRTMSVREASRVFDLHRDTVRKMLDNATPQGYTRQSPPRLPGGAEA